MAEKADFTCDFDACRTIEDSNALYGQLYKKHISTATDALMEAHRKAMARINAERGAAEKQSDRITLEDLGVTAAEVREWAKENDVKVSTRGRIRADVIRWYAEVHA